MKLINKNRYNKIQQYISGESIKDLGKTDNCAKKYFNNAKYYTDIPFGSVGTTDNIDYINNKFDPFTDYEKMCYIPFPNNIFNEVLNINSIKTVKYLYYCLHAYPINHINYAAIKNQYEIVKFLYSKGYACSQLSMFKCIKNNISFELVELMLKMPKINNLNLLNLAATSGSFSLTSYYYNKFGLDSYAIVCAAEHGFLEITKYLYNIMFNNMSKTTLQMLEQAIDIAAKNEHMDIVKFFHDVGIYLPESTYMFLIQFNYINVIKLCHTFKTDYESMYTFESVIDIAAGYLRLDIIKYFESLGKIFTIKAFYMLLSFVNDINDNTDISLNIPNYGYLHKYCNSRNLGEKTGSDITNEDREHTYTNIRYNSSSSAYYLDTCDFNEETNFNLNNKILTPDNIINTPTEIIKFLAKQICINVNIQNLATQLRNSNNNAENEIGNIMANEWKLL
jgi:hypothetical protein